MIEVKKDKWYKFSTYIQFRKDYKFDELETFTKLADALGIECYLADTCLTYHPEKKDKEI